MTLVPSLPTFQFLTEAALLAAGESIGIEAGRLAFAIDTENIFVCVDPASSPPVWSQVTGEIPPEMVLVNNESYGLSDASVYQDGQIPVPSPTGIGGWAYNNAVLEVAPRDKINWYFYSSQRQPTPITLGELTGVYALVVVNDITDPIFLQVYTKPEGPGAVPPDAGSFYRSRLTYLQPAAPLTPGIYLFHSEGYDVTGIFPEYPRVSCPLDPATTQGPQDPTEEILLAGLATNSGAAAGSIDIIARQVGLESSNLGRSNFGLEVDDLSPRIIRTLGDGSIPALIGAFETVIFNDDGGGSTVQTSVGTPLSYAEEKALYLPSGNPTQEVVIETGLGVLAVGPDGQTAIAPTTLTYPAGSLAAGTQITWRGFPPDAATGVGPRWLLSGTNYDTTGGVPSTPSWPETLAVGQETEGVMPTLQERAAFTPATEARDQLHTYWSGTGGTPEAAVNGTDDNQTASYMLPIFGEVAVSGGSTTTDVAVLVEAGDPNGFQAIIRVQLAVKQVGTGPSDENLKFVTTVWFDSGLGVLENLGPTLGDSGSFDVVNVGGTAVLQFTDATPTATGVAIIHGMADVQVVTKIPLS